MGNILDTNNIEIKALKSFRNSIDNSLKDYLHDSISIILKGMEEEQNSPTISVEQKIDAVTYMVVKSLEWRYEYEYLLQEAKYLRNV